MEEKSKLRYENIEDLNYKFSDFVFLILLILTYSFKNLNILTK